MPSGMSLPELSHTASPTTTVSEHQNVSHRIIPAIFRKYPGFHGLTFALPLLVCLLGLHAVSAQENANTPPLGYVLLQNDQVIHGQAYQLGEFVVIRKGGESEIRLPRQRVACWSKEMLHLYQYKMDHRERPDLQTHLEDAQWCMDHELLDQAQSEIDSAQDRGAEPAFIKRLRRQLEHSRHPPSPVQPIASGLPALEKSIEPTRHQEAVVPPLSHVVTQGFTKMVQLTLINRCCKCHDEKSGRPWKISKSAGGIRPSARRSQQNLNAALAYINVKKPEDSFLLLKAMTPHGGQGAPLSQRYQTASERLRYWVRLAASEMERTGLTDFDAAAQLTAPVNDRLPSTSSQEPLSSGSLPQPIRLTGTIESASLPTPQPWQPRSPNHPTTLPNRMPQVENPLDAAIFNRKYHP